MGLIYTYIPSTTETNTGKLLLKQEDDDIQDTLLSRNHVTTIMITAI